MPEDVAHPEDASSRRTSLVRTVFRSASLIGNRSDKRLPVRVHAGRCESHADAFDRSVPGGAR